MNAEEAYTECYGYINKMKRNSDSAADQFLDDDNRPNFDWTVQQVGEYALEVTVHSAEVQDFLHKWDKAEVEFEFHDKEMPDGYYDDHSNPNLNVLTCFIIDFSPYGEPTDSESSSNTWTTPPWKNKNQ